MMDWLVKNALQRDVERQHLNKILQDIRATINALDARMSAGLSEEDKIRSVVAAMIQAGNNTGIIATYNPQSKAIDFQLNPFTIALTGAVTGSGLVTGAGNVSITTTLSDAFSGVPEAPSDGLSYWRNTQQWLQVPLVLEGANTFTGPGLVYVDENGDWSAAEPSSGGVLPVVTGEVPPVLVYFDDGSLLYAPAEY